MVNLYSITNAASWLELIRVQRQFLWFLIALIACIAALIGVTAWAWFNFLHVASHPELLDDIPRDEMSPISQFPKTRYEHRDTNIGGILLFVLALAIGAVLVHVLIYEVWLHGRHEAAARDEQLYPVVRSAHRNPPAPVLQWDPTADLDSMREQEDAILSSYGWVDRNRGVVRLPIDRAIQLTAQRGLPSRPGPYEDDNAALLNQAVASGPGQPGQALTPSAFNEQPKQVPDRTFMIQAAK